LGVTSNELIAETARNLRVEKEKLDKQITKFKEDMSKLVADNPEQLRAQMLDVTAKNLENERVVAEIQGKLANLIHELGIEKGKLSKCEDELGDARSLLGHAEHEIDSYKEALSESNERCKSLEKQISSMPAHGRSSSNEPGMIELNDTVSKLLDRLQQLMHEAGGNSVDQKMKDITMLINGVLKDVKGEGTKIEFVKLFVRHLHLSDASTQRLCKDLEELGKAV